VKNMPVCFQLCEWDAFNLHYFYLSGFGQAQCLSVLKLPGAAALAENRTTVVGHI